MTPKKLLDQIAAEAGDSEIGKARYEGALAMYECFLEKQRKYYKTHAEHNREYHKRYYKIRHNKKEKEVEESK